ncbi:hypothetical protein FNV43_RR13742 [Rhamnella rubrinervis]|uniref:Uncharacterized protein n=1 Tax=Rhamnella rubrinervis TaxID=2594499 RepID=A0A8K0MFL2_9ROSA|nr:hypothetical protein FNV43_RR13742 [Rhamnella rubrinervis]
MGRGQPRESFPCAALTGWGGRQPKFLKRSLGPSNSCLRVFVRRLNLQQLHSGGLSADLGYSNCWLALRSVWHNTPLWHINCFLFQDHKTRAFARFARGSQALNHIIIDFGAQSNLSSVTATTSGQSIISTFISLNLDAQANTLHITASIEDAVGIMALKSECPYIVIPVIGSLLNRPPSIVLVPIFRCGPMGPWNKIPTIHFLKFLERARSPLLLTLNFGYFGPLDWTNSSMRRVAERLSLSIAPLKVMAGRNFFLLLVGMMTIEDKLWKALSHKSSLLLSCDQLLAMRISDRNRLDPIMVSFGFDNQS